MPSQLVSNLQQNLLILNYFLVQGIDKEPVNKTGSTGNNTNRDVLVFVIITFYLSNTLVSEHSFNLAQIYLLMLLVPQGRIKRPSDDYKSTVLSLYYKGISRGFFIPLCSSVIQSLVSNNGGYESLLCIAA